ncbi:hypothetical protein NY78_4355 [Desulfovibrio sp. TomC]|nr:hypothetical protein NY78_4355 [Desulfovibrio sp. TomC]
MPFRGKVTAAEMADIIKQAKKMREATLNNNLRDGGADDTGNQE